YCLLFFRSWALKNQTLLKGGAAFKHRDRLVRGNVMQGLSQAGRPANLKSIDAVSVFQAKHLDQTVLGLMARTGDHLADPVRRLAVEPEGCDQRCPNAVAVALVGGEGRVAFAHGADQPDLKPVIGIAFVNK